mmetsp:Transcript_33928/g.48193  ORF Transcript_33928/g.48193 Transcript_33928/m.48193 type:complete len:83 (-) Transcript_33928:1296-1544(-)
MSRSVTSQRFPTTDGAPPQRYVRAIPSGSKTIGTLCSVAKPFRFIELSFPELQPIKIITDFNGERPAKDSIFALDVGKLPPP